MNEESADEIVGTYGGDSFGNGDITMLRCRRCTGLYLKAPELYRTTRIGLILIDDGGRGRRQRESRLAEIYEHEAKCRCPRNEEDEQDGFGRLGRRVLRPPMRESESVNFTGLLLPWPSWTNEPSEEEGSEEGLE